MRNLAREFRERLDSKTSSTVLVAKLVHVDFSKVRDGPEILDFEVEPTAKGTYSPSIKGGLVGLEKPIVWSYESYSPFRLDLSRKEMLVRSGGYPKQTLWVPLENYSKNWFFEPWHFVGPFKRLNQMKDLKNAKNYFRNSVGWEVILVNHTPEVTLGPYSREGNSRFSLYKVLKPRKDRDNFPLLAHELKTDDWRVGACAKR